MASDLVDRMNEVTSRIVAGGWKLWTGIPIVTDRQERHHEKARKLDYPLELMRIGESFELTPREVGFRPCEHCGDNKLLKTANLVSSAASQLKLSDKRDEDGKRFNFKTAQIPTSGLVRIHRIKFEGEE